MTLRRAQGARIKAALGREQNPVKKGMIVALVVRHSATGTFGGRMNIPDHYTWHLATVTKADRNGRAVKVRPCGGIQAEVEAFSQFNRVMTIYTRVFEAQRLIATLDTRESNSFASADHLRTAILAFAKDTP